jgi:predicted metal-binding protein
MSDVIRSRATPWKTILLVCGKCARKMDGGYGPKGKESLRSALQTELANTGRRREVRIIETRCMGICPKKAVTVLNTRRPETILTVPRKTEVAEALGQLMGATAAD